MTVSHPSAEALAVRREYPETPIVGVGAVVIHDGQVLLVRRANEPSRGKWSIPGGVLEVGETLADAAVREVWEECQVAIAVEGVISTFDMIERDRGGRVRYHYVLIDVAASYVSGEPTAGSDSLDVRWVRQTDLEGIDLVPRLLPVLHRALGGESCPVRAN